MPKRTPFFLLLVSLLLFFVGCTSVDRPDIKEVVTGELDLLKDLDLKTTQKYISYKELFPDADKFSALPQEVEEVFSLFFQNFDYRILSLNVKEDTADASIRLQTIDAQALAKDFASARLKQYIDAVSDAEHPKEAADDSLQAHYLLLHKLLKKHTYGTVETNCTMHLIHTKGRWLIRQDRTLENELVGGFISYLANPGLLSAREAATIYFDAMKQMDTAKLAGYLGLSDTLNVRDASRKALANELMRQIHRYFDYEILSCTGEDYLAEVRVRLTTMDARAILKRYNEALEQYLSTAEAVIAGPEGRRRQSQALLLDEISENTSSAAADLSVRLVNDGSLWKLEMNEDIGNVLLNHLAHATDRTKLFADEED